LPTSLAAGQPLLQSPQEPSTDGDIPNPFSRLVSRSYKTRRSRRPAAIFQTPFRGWSAAPTEPAGAVDRRRYSRTPFSRLVSRSYKTR